jgi:hypothetical protein
MKDLLELAELAWHGELDLQFEHPSGSYVL